MQVEYLKNLVRIDRTLSYNFFLYGKERILTHSESVNINIFDKLILIVNSGLDGNCSYLFEDDGMSNDYKEFIKANIKANMLNLTKKTLNQFFLPTLTLPCQ